MGKDRTILCPMCGHELRRTSIDVEYYKCLGMTVYDAYCDGCNTVVGIEDKASFEQEGKIIITFT
jgi:hypothetical protein